jgi:hypothetical protein
MTFQPISFARRLQAAVTDSRDMLRDFRRRRQEAGLQAASPARHKRRRTASRGSTRTILGRTGTASNSASTS